MKFFNRLVISLILLYPLLSGMACQPVASPLPPVSATLTPGTTLGRLNPGLFGTNVQWEWAGDGLLTLPEGEKTTFHESALAKAKALHITSVRFPGGALANTYQWQQGIGARSKRAAGTSFAGHLAPSQFGTDELLALTAELHAEPLLTVNLNWTTAQAREWVRYITQAAKKHPGSQPAQFWELGNELYSPDQPGHSSAKDYARTANQMAAAMKQENKLIKTGAILEISFLQAAWMKSVYPHLLTWNEEVISQLSDDIDFVSVHFYAPYDKLRDSVELSQLVLAAPEVFRQNIEAIRHLLAKYGKSRINIAVTEYNTFFGDKLKLDPRTGGSEAALFNALMLMEMAAMPDIVRANHWSLINNAVFGLIETEKNSSSRERPSYDVFHTLAAQANHQAKSVTINGPSYAVSAIGNIPTLPKVPMLKALLTQEKNGKKTLNIINRSSNQPIEVDLSGFVDGASTVTQSQWAGYGTTDWKTQLVKQPANLNHGKTTLPPHSFTVLSW